MKTNEFKSVCVIGLGYVGLPTAAILAAQGIEVLGVDNDPLTVELINIGKTHIVEPDLDELVKNVLKKGNFRAKTTPAPADAFIIAVPTPFSKNHRPNLSHVKEAIRSLSHHLLKGNLIVIESTCPVGTSEQASKWLSKLRKDLKFPHVFGEKADVNIAHSPERVLPGRILAELIRNDRVIGGVSMKCAERTKALYKIVVKGDCFLTDAKTAELVKLAENAFRDVNIAFANELSLVCDKLDINPWDAIDLANHHPRVNILKPGPGVGGHCIAVDPWVIVNSAPDLTPLIQRARKVNDGKPKKIVKKILAAIQLIKNPTVGCFGLAYKNDIADLRESPAIEIAKELASVGDVNLLIVEPYINSLPKQLLNYRNVHLVDADDALDRADVLVLLTDHSSFKSINPEKLLKKQVFDTRGIWRKFLEN